MSTIREYPLLLKGPMVRAVLDGSKTMTRRPIKPQPALVTGKRDLWRWHPRRGYDVNMEHLNKSLIAELSPYGGPGDKLWVREKFIAGWDASNGDLQQYDESGNELPKKAWYAADDNGEGFCWLGDDGNFRDNIPWKPSIHMPRWACRTLLTVTDVRVERVADITEAGCWAEGIPETRDLAPCLSLLDSPIPAFKLLWDSIYKDTLSFDSNPWVWAITFKTTGSET